jgi:predicted metal-dependent peptidase
MAEATALYAHRGTRAIQRMVEFAPSTGGLALWVRHLDLPADAAAPAAATNGYTVFYGESFEHLPVAEQAGLVAHEVLHIALRHPQRFLELRQLLGDVDLQLFNTCADAIVNSALGHLSWLTLPSAAVQLDRLLLQALSLDQGVEAALLEWDVERLYRAIDDRGPQAQDGRARAETQPRDDKPGRKAAQAGSQGGTQGQEAAPTGPQDDPQHGTKSPAERQDGPRAARVRAMGSGSPIDLLPAADTRASPESEAEQAREWSERLLRAHAGDGAHSMLRTLVADLPRTRTPWEQLLRTQLARSLSHRLGISWSRPVRSYLANQGRVGPHRRMPWEPGVSPSKSVPRLVVIVDVSGSIEDALMERFAREIEAITRRLEAGLVLVIGDERVQKVQRFEPGRGELRDIEFKGGGGTDFTPLLEEAERHRPDIVVVLTDLDGPARFQPRWPVIWAVPEVNRAAVAPFGRKLVLV